MKSVADQVISLLRGGQTVRGSIELPDSLVLWDLDFDGTFIKFQARDYIGLDDQIPFAVDEPANGLGLPVS